MKVRLLWFGAVMWFGFAGPWWIFLLLLFSYIIRFVGMEVLLVAVLVDAAYGYASMSWPAYTILTTAVLLVVTLLEPRLHWYHK